MTKNERCKATKLGSAGRFSHLALVDAGFPKERGFAQKSENLPEISSPLIQSWVAFF